MQQIIFFVKLRICDISNTGEPAYCRNHARAFATVLFLPPRAEGISFFGCVKGPTGLVRIPIRRSLIVQESDENCSNNIRDIISLRTAERWNMCCVANQGSHRVLLSLSGGEREQRPFPLTHISSFSRKRKAPVSLVFDDDYDARRFSSSSLKTFLLSTPPRTKGNTFPTGRDRVRNL